MSSRSKLILKFGLIYAAFLALCWHKLDPDFGWHLKAGDYYRQHGIPSRDIFTYTARNFPWINHEWGNDLLVSLVYTIGGYGLLSGLYAAIWTAVFYLRARTVSLLFLAAGISAMLPFAGIRPVAWTVLLFTILLNLLDRPKKPPLWLIPLMFGLWANLHGGFIIGLAVILYYFVHYRQSYYSKLLGLSIVATFVNPYGPRLYVEIGRTLFDSHLHNQIAEWNTFTVYGPSLVFICLWWAGFWIFERRPLKNWLGLSPLLFAASMSANRNTPLFTAAALPDLERFYRQFRREVPKKLNRAAKIILYSFTAVVAGAVIYGAYPSFWPWGSREDGYPAQAVAFLQQHPCAGHLFNDYNYGGYLIWKLPSEPVYIDGRMSSWRDKSGQKYLNTYLSMDNSAVRNRQFSKYDIKCVLLRSSDTNMLDHLKKAGWQTKIQANGATLLETTSGK